MEEVETKSRGKAVRFCLPQPLLCYFRGLSTSFSDGFLMPSRVHSIPFEIAVPILVLPVEKGPSKDIRGVGANMAGINSDQSIHLVCC